jgi:diadenosine tetraphosphate (Ap4A) HIT family hydrolase
MMPRTVEGTLDANPYLTRIQEERQIHSDDLYYVVADGEPIVEGHHLIVSRKEVQSFADMDSGQLMQFLHKYLEKMGGESYWILERGRAKSCTSFNGLVHAHGHLIPAHHMHKVLFAEDSQAYGSLQAALDAIPKQVEYLLWGPLNGPVRVSLLTGHLPKRHIRNVMTASLGIRTG